MDIKRLILDKLHHEGKISSAQVTKQTGFSRAYINRFFQELKNEGKIVMFGRTKSAAYVLAEKDKIENQKIATTFFKHTFAGKNLTEEDVLREVKQNSGVFMSLKDNVRNIVEYAFLEMVNNAIEHAGSQNIEVLVSKGNGVVRFLVHDDGIGIFEHLRNKLNLPDILSAVQQLLKGKQTTDPTNHSGQGIFFTSKMADAFVIKSSGKVVLFNNLIPDLFIEDRKTPRGTTIGFSIASNSTKTAEEIFREFTNEEYEFSKTKIKVKLYKISRNLLSRSEARRILLGLESFSEITLDFQGVESVGQSFADEIFRVWKNKNPERKIEFENANENVEFMIKRSI